MRLGVLVPAGNPTIEPELYRMAPRGLTVHFARLQSLAGDGRFCFENASRLALALDRYQRGRGDLADYLLGTRAREGGAVTTFTFDRDLGKDDLFTVLG